MALDTYDAINGDALTKSDPRNDVNRGRSANSKPEIPGALQHLDDQLGKVQELSKQLEMRLCSVLRAAPPEATAKGLGFIATTQHGQILRECVTRASATAHVIEDILDRLEL